MAAVLKLIDSGAKGNIVTVFLTVETDISVPGFTNKRCIYDFTTA